MTVVSHEMRPEPLQELVRVGGENQAVEQEVPRDGGGIHALGKRFVEVQPLLGSRISLFEQPLSKKTEPGVPVRRQGQDRKLLAQRSTAFRHE